MRVLAVALAVALSTSGCSFGRGGGDGERAAPFQMGLVRPASLDPIKAGTVDEQMIAEQLFDTLVTIDPDTAEPLPGLAESWTTSDDGLRWEFQLTDATFSDGEPITAFDVEATFDRAVLRSSGSRVADLLEPVVGWREAAVDGTATELAGVTAMSDDVVAIQLTAPWGSLPSALSHPGLGVVSRADVGAADFDDRPTGSGAYTVAERDDDRIVLRAVKGRTTKLDRIEVRLFPDQAKAYDEFAKGRLDWSPVPLSRVDEAAARYGRKYFRSYVAELFYAFNLRNPKWADARLRVAAARAIDTKKIIDDVYAGALRPMTSLSVAGLPGAPPATCGDLCVHDPEAAKTLLGEVTASGGTVPPITIDFEDDAAQAAVAAQMEADLEAVGFDVTLHPLPLDDYERFAVSGEQDVFRLGWIAAYPAVDAFLAPLFLSGSANNLPGFALSSVDELIVQGRASTDPAARAAAFEQAERAIFAEAPIIPIGQFQQHWVARQPVRDLRLTVSGTFDAASVWLAGD
ncbi:MAG TPA: ABC transporter substrate-binding protein [Acidimicrobiales bacterium]|nr:ABC transporter substrate-binding protein [Acidimicrobiales bacterium]